MRLPFPVKWWYGVVGVVVVVLVSGCVIFFKSRSVPSALLSPLPSPSMEESEIETVVPEGLPSPNPLSSEKPPETLSILLLGYGGSGHAGGFLSDAITLVQFNLAKKRLALISIPRDLWVELPSGRMAKINAAFASFGKNTDYPSGDVQTTQAYAGALVSEQVVRTVTGIKPDYYVAIDFFNFARLVDALGGLEVQVHHAFDDPFYPVVGKELEACGKTPEEITTLSNTLSGFELEKQFPCRYERVKYDVGLASMNGEAALKFVRSRHSVINGSDFARGERQREVLVAMKQKLLSREVFTNLKQIYATLSKLIHSDINWEIVQSAAKILPDVANYTVIPIGLTTDNVLQSQTENGGQAALVPRAGSGQWQDVRVYISQQLTANSQ